MEGKHDELSNSEGFLDTGNIDRKGLFCDTQVFSKVDLSLPLYFCLGKHYVLPHDAWEGHETAKDLEYLNV